MVSQVGWFVCITNVYDRRTSLDDNYDRSKINKTFGNEKVNEYMANIQHPLADVLEALRQIGEEIKWNALTFYFTGAMLPFPPKEYKRVLVVSNLFRGDRIRLVFLGGSKVNDPNSFLEGDYADGRRLATFYDMEDVKMKEKILRAVVTQQLELLKK